MANSSLFKTHEKQKANTVYIGPNFRGKIVAQKKKEDKKKDIYRKKKLENKQLK